MRGASRHTIFQRKSERPAEIHKQIVAVYGNVMSGQRTDVHDEQRSGRPF